MLKLMVRNYLHFYAEKVCLSKPVYLFSKLTFKQMQFSNRIAEEERAGCFTL